MCHKTVFNPTGPCCKATSNCQAWPSVDWNSFTWLVTLPDAELLQRDTVYQRRNGMLNANTWNYESGQLTGPGSHASEAQVGTGIYIPGADVLFGPSAHWFRGGRYLASHNDRCVWRVLNREQLIHRHIALIGCIKTFPYDLPGYPAPANQAWWYLSAASMMTSEQLAYWDSKRARQPEILTVTNGFPFFGPAGDITPNETYVSIRDVFPRIACEWLPHLRSRSDISYIHTPSANGAVYDPLTVIYQLENSDADGWYNENLYRPTALDVAASVALGPGFLFGFVTDPRSPVFGHFTCFEGAIYADGGEGEDGASDPVLQSVPWRLDSGSAVIAALGYQNVFTRTSDDASLPSWFTLELIRI